MKNNRFSKGLTTSALIGIIVLIIIVIGAVYFYSDQGPSADEVFAEANFSLEGVSSVDETSNLELSVDVVAKSGDLTTNTNVELKLSIESLTDQENLNADASLNVEKLTLTSGPVMADFSGIEAEVMVIDGLPYILLGKVPDSLLFYPGVNEAIGRWIKVDANESLNSQFIGQGGQLNKEIVEKLKEALGNEKIFVLEDYLGKDTIAGVKTYHYRVSISREALQRIVDFYVETINTEFGEEVAMTEEEVAFIKDFVENFDLKTIDIEVWVGREDKLPYKSLLTVDLGGILNDFVGAVVENTIPEAQDVEFSGILTVDEEVKAYNEEVSIEVPEEAISILDFLNEIYAIPE